MDKYFQRYSIVAARRLAEVRSPISILKNETYSNLRRDRDPTSVVLELPELIEVVRIYLDAQVHKKRIRSVTQVFKNLPHAHSCH